MSESSRELVSSGKPKITGPDFFSYYARVVADLVQSEELVSFFPIPKDSESAFKVLENGKGFAKPLFSDIMADSTSEVKQESLKTLLRECISTLGQEADEILDPVVSLRHELTQLKSKKELLSAKVECKDKQMERPCKKLKTELSYAHGMSLGDGTSKTDLNVQDDDGEDIALDLKIMGKFAKEYALTIHHMEEKLEAILENITSQCRKMTHLEKQELKISIQKLPPGNLERVAEIMFRSKPSVYPSSDEVLVDLENEDNITLWRLYFYIKAVDNGKMTLADIIAAAKVAKIAQPRHPVDVAVIGEKIEEKAKGKIPYDRPSKPAERKPTKKPEAHKPAGKRKTRPSDAPPEAKKRKEGPTHRTIHNIDDLHEHEKGTPEFMEVLESVTTIPTRNQETRAKQDQDPLASPERSPRFSDGLEILETPPKGRGTDAPPTGFSAPRESAGRSEKLPESEPIPEGSKRAHRFSQAELISNGLRCMQDLTDAHQNQSRQLLDLTLERDSLLDRVKELETSLSRGSQVVADAKKVEAQLEKKIALADRLTQELEEKNKECELQRSQRVEAIKKVENLLKDNELRATSGPRIL